MGERWCLCGCVLVVCYLVSVFIWIVLCRIGMFRLRKVCSFDLNQLFKVQSSDMMCVCIWLDIYSYRSLFLLHATPFLHVSDICGTFSFFVILLVWLFLLLFVGICWLIFVCFLCCSLLLILLHAYFVFLFLIMSSMCTLYHISLLLILSRWHCILHCTSLTYSSFLFCCNLSFF